MAGDGLAEKDGIDKAKYTELASRPIYGRLFVLEYAKMTNDYSFLKEYSLDYLISNKDKKSDFYQMLRNTCVYLLDGHSPDEAELRVSWSNFKMFFLVGIYLEDRPSRKIFNVFADHFNHSEESSDEFSLWLFSDMINETANADWEAMPEIPIDTSILEVKPHSGVRSEGVKLFFQDYVGNGGGQIPQPSKDDMQSFAKETLRLIEEPKTKETLKKITLGRFIDWLPEEVQKTLDKIGRLTLRDGEMLVAAKPLLEDFREVYSASQSTIIDLSAGDMQEPQNVNPEIEERQKQVFELKQYGHDDKYIANKLSVTTKTVQRDKRALGILKPHKKGH